MLLTGSTFFWVIVVWTAAIGGSVGSFLNVVVYRLPAGMSLVHPGSHCPKCKHPIRWHDNVPVLGWLALRGRCRDCSAWIPLRYPAVEALAAAILVVLMVCEGLSGGANLPPRAVPVADGLIFPSLTAIELAGLAAWHFLLLCTLLAVALIRYDGHPVPGGLYLPALACGLAGSLFWPHLHPQPALMLPGGPTPGLLDGAAGLVFGGAVGALVGLLPPRASGPDTARSGALVGLFLGWQAALATVPLSWIAAVLLPSRHFGPGWSRGARFASMTALALGWILVWANLARAFPEFAGG